MFRKFVLLIIILVGAVGLLWFADISRDVKIIDSPFGSVSPSSSASPSPSSKTSPWQTQTVQPQSKSPPASCSLAGSVEFKSSVLYENKGAIINYKNIDSVARHIIWSIAPQDNLSVGPNLFANLPIPDGVEDVSVVLPENPKSKNFTLTAKVTYGVFVNGNLEIKESVCSGRISVKLNY